MPSQEPRIYYVVADTFAGRTCHAVTILKEGPKRYRVRFHTQVCARVPAGHEQWIGKDRVFPNPPAWAKGDKAPVINPAAARCALTDQQIAFRLEAIERMLAVANPKDLPALNATFQRLLDEQVRRDLEKAEHHAR